MKQSTIESMLIARSLFEQAGPLCLSEDRHLASAGLIIIQDCLEIVFYALLLEKNLDETFDLNKKTFDELLSLLNKSGYSVPKSTTIRALNKQRVIVKHHGQLAEPITVATYYKCAEYVIENLVLKVLGKRFREIFLTDLLQDGEAKNHLKAAEEFISQREYINALIEIRKSIFIEFESNYSLHGWREIDKNLDEPLGMKFLARGGLKTHRWMRNKQWVDNNVSDPTKYVQINFEDWRIDALEYGINTAELNNLQRLTPAVFRTRKGESWAVKINSFFTQNEACEADSKYCLDRAISIISKKQRHIGIAREPSEGKRLNPQIYLGEHLYKRATTKSEVIHTISLKINYEIEELVDGFESPEKFYFIRAWSDTKNEHGFPDIWKNGYLQQQPEDPLANGYFNFNQGQ